ncbi:MAG: hypothetical protein GC189_06295 [Alphaproteobacteria bacterium]|nr:hypothetical protein [Alphaproteobacteria bacterium]
MNEIVFLGASALIVAVLALIAAAMGFRARVQLVTREDVQRALDAAEPGALLREVAIDQKGRAAIALLSDGRVALIKAMADGAAVRALKTDQVRVRVTAAKAGVRVRASMPDFGFPSVVLSLGAAPDWLSLAVGQDAAAPSGRAARGHLPLAGEDGAVLNVKN